MSKLVRTLAVILIAFALASLLLYRFRLGALPRSAVNNGSQHGIVEETKTVEGQIQTVDPGTNTLTLVNDDDGEVKLSFDERTAVLDSGHPIQPTTITSGTNAKVKYTQRGSKRWARKIELAHAEPADSIESY